MNGPKSIRIRGRRYTSLRDTAVNATRVMAGLWNPLSIHKPNHQGYACTPPVSDGLQDMPNPIPSHSADCEPLGFRRC